LIDLWTAEAGRNDVLPISDGLVDRFGGFIPPAWPPGSSRTFLPGGGPIADESVPLLWGGFHLSADVETARDADGVICALGDWFGGYALYASAGAVHFTFARSADAIELVTPSALDVGRHVLAVAYETGTEHGRMTLIVDGVEVDSANVDGFLPMALQHGGAGLRLGCDSGFPVSARYSPPAPFNGTVHRLTIETPGAHRPDPADEVRAALHAD
jgi:arylsulfatase